MAKRFTDTAKWDKAWFRKLSPEMKCAWVFLCDRCDHAGVWEVDLDALQFFVGAEISLLDIEETFGDRVREVGNKLVLEGFAEFQYGSLKPENRVHKSVIDRLEKVAPKKGLTKTLKGHKDTDTDKDKDKDTEKEKDFKTRAKKFRDLFPGSTTGPKASERFAEQIKTPQDLSDLDRSLDHYAAVLKAQTWRQPKTTFEIYLGTKSSGYFWRDFIEMPDLPEAAPLTDAEAKERALFEQEGA